MNRIRLTPDRLIIGREIFVRADLDPVFGVQPSVLLTPDEQDLVEEAWPLPPDGDVRIAGGSWGRRIGTLLRDARTNQALAVFSRQPELLSQRLTQWLTDVPDTPERLVDLHD